MKKQRFGIWLIQLCLLVLIGIIWMLYLQHTQAFNYFYREQQQIFLNDFDYVVSLLKPMGGLVLIVSQWLVQFFVEPYMGALITTLLCLFIAVFLILLVDIYKQQHWWLMPLAFLPPMLYGLCLEEVYIHYEGLVAMAFGAFCLWLYTCLPKGNAIIRTVGGIILALALFYAAGPVAIIISISMLLLDLMRKEVVGKPYGILPLITVLLAGLWAYYQQWRVDAASIYWMNGYAEYYFEPTALHTLTWISIPLWVLLCWIAGKLGNFATWMKVSLTCCLLALVTIVCLSIHKAQAHPAYEALLQQTHYADTEEWDKLTQVSGISASNDVQMNYLNLALAKQGLLLDNLFAVPQKDIGSIITRDARYTDVGVLLSRIYYHIGAIGAAQNQAFSSVVGITYCNPSMTKLLIKTYLINGYYALAEKLIARLEKTWYYADWASNQRRFLYNDVAVEADPELGTKRRYLANDNRYTMLYGPVDDLVTMLTDHPENREAAEYLLSMFLISKDVNSIQAFINQFAGKGSMEEAPIRLQEAIVLLHEHDTNYCLEHGVSRETLQAFEAFRQTYMTLRNQGRDVRALTPQYGKTFWYYMIR